VRLVSHHLRTAGQAGYTGGKPPAGTRREARKKSEAPKPAEMATVPVLIPQNVSIKDGQINLLTQSRAPVNIKGIDLSLKEFSSDAPFPFKASFNYPGLKTISLEGELDYQEEKSLLELKNNRLTIQDLTLPVQGGVSNLFTAPRVNLNLKSDNVDAGKIFQILSVFSLAPRDTEISGPMSLNLNVNGTSNLRQPLPVAPSSNSLVDKSANKDYSEREREHLYNFSQPLVSHSRTLGKRPELDVNRILSKQGS